MSGGFFIPQHASVYLAKKDSISRTALQFIVFTQLYLHRLLLVN